MSAVNPIVKVAKCNKHNYIVPSVLSFSRSATNVGAPVIGQWIDKAFKAFNRQSYACDDSIQVIAVSHSR
jgi:hypothetical protein